MRPYLYVEIFPPPPPPLIKYGLILLSSSSGAYRIFKIQMRVVWIMIHSRHCVSYKTLFKFNAIPLPSLYIFDGFVLHSKINICMDHRHTTMDKYYFIFLIYRLKVIEDSPFLNGMKLFNKLPHKLCNFDYNTFLNIIR